MRKIKLEIFNYIDNLTVESMWRIKFPSYYFNDESSYALILCDKIITKRLTRKLINKNLKNLFSRHRTSILHFAGPYTLNFNFKPESYIFEGMISPKIFDLSNTSPYYSIEDSINDLILLLVNNLKKEIDLGK